MNDDSMWQYTLLVIVVWVLFTLGFLAAFVAAAIPDWLDK